MRLGQGGSDAVLINGPNARFAGAITTQTAMEGYSTFDTMFAIATASAKFSIEDYLGVDILHLENSGQLNLLADGAGIEFSSPDGLTQKVLTIDNAGAPVWT